VVAKVEKESNSKTFANSEAGLSALFIAMGNRSRERFRGAFPELNSTVAGSFRAARLQARVVTNGQNFTSIDVERSHRTEEFVIRRSSECYCETRRTDVAVQPISHGLSCTRCLLLPSLPPSLSLSLGRRKDSDILSRHYPSSL